MRSLVFAGLSLLPVLLGAFEARADVYVTPKHLIILRQGLDSLYGSYVFAVQNTGEAPETLKARVMLPKETVDFMPQEGLDPSEVTLADGPDGGLQIDKSFPNGVHIVSIGFKVDARLGKAGLTLTPVSEIQSFTLLLPRDSGLTLVTSPLVDGDESAAPDPQYRPFVSAAPLAAGAAFNIEVAGIPEGRSRLWLVGGVLAGLMVLAAGLFAWRTKPKITEDTTGGQILVG